MPLAAELGLQITKCDSAEKEANIWWHELVKVRKRSLETWLLVGLLRNLNEGIQRAFLCLNHPIYFNCSPFVFSSSLLCLSCPPTPKTRRPARRSLLRSPKKRYITWYSLFVFNFFNSKQHKYGSLYRYWRYKFVSPGEEWICTLSIQSKTSKRSKYL